MNFDILGFLWFLIKILGLLVLVSILSSILINVIRDFFTKSKERKRKEQLDKLLEEAIKNQSYNLEIFATKDEMDKKIKDNKK